MFRMFRKKQPPRPTLDARLLPDLPPAIREQLAMIDTATRQLGYLVSGSQVLTHCGTEAEHMEANKIGSRSVRPYTWQPNIYTNSTNRMKRKPPASLAIARRAGDVEPLIAPGRAIQPTRVWSSQRRCGTRSRPRSLPSAVLRTYSASTRSHSTHR